MHNSDVERRCWHMPCSSFLDLEGIISRKAEVQGESPQSSQKLMLTTEEAKLVVEWSGCENWGSSRPTCPPSLPGERKEGTEHPSLLKFPPSPLSPPSVFVVLFLGCGQEKFIRLWPDHELQVAGAVRPAGVSMFSAAGSGCYTETGSVFGPGASTDMGIKHEIIM